MKPRRTLPLAAAAAAALAAPGAGIAADDPGAHPVIELRQYKIVAGKRDAMIALFEREFVESQEVLGMRLVGQFRDRDDANRFVWVRAFPSMEARGKALNDFYFGPVWKAHRDEANPLLDDNDDVLLLQPAWPGSEFAPAKGRRPAPGAPAPAAGMVVATIEYLWKQPSEGYAAYFRDTLAPAYRAAGLPVLAAFVPETQPNNFPRLYVRQNERLLVWFTRVADLAAYQAAQRKLRATAAWRRSLQPALADYRERTPQVLTLSPTPRSLLR
ncbi:MAG: NIPSNAP family protein [Sphingomonas sp.]|uniref:NIPSNAP family protein n=1 Tax=Sphingomonas sp. TaxID=28214 RepID=UPI003F7F55AC